MPRGDGPGEVVYISRTTAAKLQMFRENVDEKPGDLIRKLVDRHLARPRANGKHEPEIPDDSDYHIRRLRQRLLTHIELANTVDMEKVEGWIDQIRQIKRRLTSARGHEDRKDA